MKNKGEILAAILRNYSDCYFFLHNTREFSTVKKILSEGFIFESQLAYSTDRVSPAEPIEITYFLIQRQDYGPYTIVVAIPKVIYEIYSDISNLNETGIEEILTISEPYYGDNDELMYTLSPKHILGYFNTRTSEFFKNVNWDQLFNSCLYRTQAKKPVKPDR